MSGHSKWSTIKRAKGLTDIKRGATFTKISNVIALSARSGGSGDPDDNPRLRFALEQAKSVNMPKDNIQRAIDRGLGKLAGQTIDEVVYEGFGPGRVAFYVEGLTDNKLRTTSEIKNMFERSGGNMGGIGSVSYMFDRLGEIKVASKGGSSDDEILELIDLGAADVEEFLEPFDFAQGKDMQMYLVYTESSELNTMGNKITQAGFKVELQEIVMKPKVLQQVADKEVAQKVLEFASRLEDHDDIQKVFANFDIPDELMES